MTYIVMSRRQAPRWYFIVPPAGRFSRGYDYDQLPEAPTFSINFYRQFFDYLETPLAVCQQLGRFSRSGDWQEPALCLSEPVDLWRVLDCLVYSFRHTADADADSDAYEQGAAGQLGCEVHVFQLGGKPHQPATEEVGAGSVTWHMLGGPSLAADLGRIVERLGHEDRDIHHLRLALNSRLPGGRLPAFLRRLGGDDLELLGRQVVQLQLVLELRPAALEAATLSSYQQLWATLSELHRRGFSVLHSGVASRLSWLPGLGRQVAADYSLLLAKHMPFQSRRSAQLRLGNSSAPQQVYLLAR